MKIKLASTLPFTPIQLHHDKHTSLRSVGKLKGRDQGRDVQMTVYEYYYGEDDIVRYRVESEEAAISRTKSVDNPFVGSLCAESDLELIWIEHDQRFTYQSYAFLVMNALSELVGDWDGIVYRSPRGERLHESLWQATLQVVDSCVCNRTGLWAMVQLNAEATDSNVIEKAAVSQVGWVRLAV